jgi:UDP-N-acetylglucosamine 4-epimerase
MRVPDDIKENIFSTNKTWLITGVCGFIGSNILEHLLLFNQTVVGVDNLSTGHLRNLKEVERLVSPEQWRRFHFFQGDVRDASECRRHCTNVDYVLHQAALGSVPRSIEDPISTNQHNVDGFLNMITAAKDARVKRFVYAASSSTYGDHPGLPKREDEIGRPLSPYAVSKLVNELYAEVFAQVYDFKSIGLRYFNVFGPRQDPEGPYAAVIPKWVAALRSANPVFINGDGETTRDFCFVENVVQANILAAMTSNPEALGQVYNIAFGEQTSLNELFHFLRDYVLKTNSALEAQAPIYRNFRAGDVRHSLADIGKARKLLGYNPSHSVSQGLAEAVNWYIKN